MTDKEINKVAINLTALAFAKLTNEDKEKRVFELAEIIGIKKLVLLEKLLIFIKIVQDLYIRGVEV